MNNNMRIGWIILYKFNAALARNPTNLQFVGCKALHEYRRNMVNCTYTILNVIKI